MYNKNLFYQRLSLTTIEVYRLVDCYHLSRIYMESCFSGDAEVWLYLVFLHYLISCTSEVTSRADQSDSTIHDTQIFVVQQISFVDRHRPSILSVAGLMAFTMPMTIFKQHFCNSLKQKPLLCDAHTVPEPHKRTAAFFFLLTIVLFHFFFLCVCHSW